MWCMSFGVSGKGLYASVYVIFVSGFFFHNTHVSILRHSEYSAMRIPPVLNCALQVIFSQNLLVGNGRLIAMVSNQTRPVRNHCRAH